MAATGASFVGPKGRPPLRSCPADFDVIFVEQGRLGCENWYRASRSTVNRWMAERDAKRLIDARAAYVAHQRSQGAWITRQTRMIEHKEIRKAGKRLPICDRRKVSFTLARHAAQHLRIVRNGGYIVSPADKDEWWVGSRRLSAAQMVDLAESKGFDRVGIWDDEETLANPAQRSGSFKTRKEVILRQELFKKGHEVRGYKPTRRGGVGGK